jgi:hypothetical protein
MQSSRLSRRRSSRSIRSLSAARQDADSRAQSARVGTRPSGSSASAAAMSASGMPTRCAARTNATRRRVSRVNRRWLPVVRRLWMRPRAS